MRISPKPSRTPSFDGSLQGGPCAAQVEIGGEAEYDAPAISCPPPMAFWPECVCVRARRGSPPRPHSAWTVSGPGAYNAGYSAQPAPPRLSGVIGQGQLEVSHQEMRLRSSTHSTVRPIGNCWHLAYEMRTGSHLSRLSLGLSRTRRFKSATETDRGSATNGRLPCYHERGVSRRPARPQHDAFGDMIEVAPALFGIT
jgi:hypothetical protein